MTDERKEKQARPDSGRRKFLKDTGAGIAASMAAATLPGMTRAANAMDVSTIRWGIVGTGMIANSMAQMIKIADAAELVAVSSRRMETAQVFAEAHGAGRSFDSWAEMSAWDGIDAVYVATPTSVREEISVAAAKNGKHVLGEKPFASFPSLRRITDACRDNGVGFMDGTHFVHHPRTAAIQAATRDRLGRPWNVDSAFQFPLGDTSNIRLNRELEPMGAIGDAGWYNMRAAVEYLSPEIEIDSVSAHVRRHPETGAAMGASGVISFDDGATTTWNCGFDSGAVVMDLRLSAPGGIISLGDFLSQNQDGSADYLFRKGGWGPNAESTTVNVPSAKPGAVLMFEDFAAMVANREMFEKSVHASERTQRWLDAIWLSALENERR
jgi:predicted dehydrogenase